MMDRVIKAVPGYEDKYYLDPNNMQVVNSRTGRPLKPRMDSKGYAEVQLWKNNKGKHARLHKLFAEAYVPNPENLPCVNHKDENTMNYSIDNLEWCDESYNQRYGTANERRGPKISKALKGRPRPWAYRHDPVPVISVDRYGVERHFQSSREAARQLDLSQSSISLVLRGQRESTCGYKFYYE